MSDKVTYDIAISYFLLCVNLSKIRPHNRRVLIEASVETRFSMMRKICAPFHIRCAAILNESSVVAALVKLPVSPIMPVKRHSDASLDGVAPLVLKM